MKALDIRSAASEARAANVTRPATAMMDGVESPVDQR